MRLTGPHPAQNDDGGNGRIHKRRVGFGQRHGHGLGIGDGGLTGQIGLAQQYEMHAGGEISIIVMMEIAVIEATVEVSLATAASKNAIDGFACPMDQELQLLYSVDQAVEGSTPPYMSQHAPFCPSCMKTSPGLLLICTGKSMN